MSAALDLTGYKLTFDDEFNAFSSNGPFNPYVTGHTGTWDTTYSYGERKLNDEVQMYSDPTVGVDPFSAGNGVLTITAAPSADPALTWGQTYTSGAITTFHSFAQQYGYFEMRAKLPEGVGMWPAFWMLPVQHVWPPELDPLEAFGSNGSAGDAGAYSLHSGLNDTGGSWGGWHDTGGANLYTQYNTFGVDWQPDTITFYFNGSAYASVATPPDFNQPMYMLANLAVGGNWAGAPIGETAALRIDYIRAYSKNGANPAVVQQSISSPDGRGYSFYGAVDANGNAALGGADLPAPAPTTAPPMPLAPIGDQAVGTGPDVLVLAMSEDYYQGDAQFTVAVDGVRIGDILSTSASHSAGAVQRFSVYGDFGLGTHTVTINFTNNYGGPTGADRNLFLSGATINGTAIAGAVLEQYSGGVRSFTFTVVAPIPAVPTPAAPNPTAPIPAAPITVAPIAGTGVTGSAATADPTPGAPASSAPTAPSAGSGGQPTPAIPSGGTPVAVQPAAQPQPVTAAPTASNTAAEAAAPAAVPPAAAATPVPAGTAAAPLDAIPADTPAPASHTTQPAASVPAQAASPLPRPRLEVPRLEVRRSWPTATARRARAA